MDKLVTLRRTKFRCNELLKKMKCEAAEKKKDKKANVKSVVAITNGLNQGTPGHKAFTVRPFPGLEEGTRDLLRHKKIHESHLPFC